MDPVKKISTPLPDVFLLEPRVFGDERGFFLESYNEKVFADLGIPHHFVQDNHSRSSRNVLRGLHYQIRQTQGKLVRVLPTYRRSSTGLGLQLVYTSRPPVPPAVAVFADYVLEKLGDTMTDPSQNQATR